MLYKKAYVHTIRIQAPIMSTETTGKIKMAAGLTDIPGFIVRMSQGYWDHELSGCIEIEYISEKRLPRVWLSFIREIKSLFKQDCVLSSVQTIEKECTCED